MSESSVRVAIVGATGVVGRELLRLLAERKTPVELVGLAASARSAGTVLEFRSERYTVQNLEAFCFDNVDLAFFSAGSSVSHVHARRAAAEGALVIDNTNAFRMDPNTPLVVPQVNADELRVRPLSNIIANPNCSTIPIVRLLDAVHRTNPVRAVIASTYQAASGAGLSGIAELDHSTYEVLNATSAQPVQARFAAPLGFNAVPSIDVLQGDGFTLEEEKMRQEARKILKLPQLRVSATCVRVPVRNCHSAAVYVQTTEPVSAAELTARWRASPDVQVYEGSAFPTPRVIGASDLVHVGRIRVDPDDPRAFWFWVVSDNVRVGAALNAVQIAECLLQMRSFVLQNVCATSA